MKKQAACAFVATALAAAALARHPWWDETWWRENPYTLKELIDLQDQANQEVKARLRYAFTYKAGIVRVLPTAPDGEVYGQQLADGVWVTFRAGVWVSLRWHVLHARDERVLDRALRGIG